MFNTIKFVKMLRIETALYSSHSHYNNLSYGIIRTNASTNKLISVRLENAPFLSMLEPEPRQNFYPDWCHINMILLCNTVPQGGFSGHIPDFTLSKITEKKQIEPNLHTTGTENKSIDV
jgi:hypothetical protein